MKSRSITKRLSMQIMILVLSFSGMILVANTLLIRPLYEASIENAMVEAVQALRQVEYLDDMDLWVDEIRAIGSGKAFDITIETKGQTIYSSSREIGLKEPDWNEGNTLADQLVHPRNPSFPVQEVRSWKDEGEGIRIGSLREPKNNSEMVVCNLELENGLQIFLTQPFEPVLESIRQANILLLGGTLFFLVIASVLAFRIAKSFTLPIREMQTYVGQLSELDFSGKVVIQTGDELENLSRDINALSCSLEETLASLEEKNELLAKEIRSQKRLISDASHELRTPLTLIQGYADEISAGFVPDAEKQREYVGYIADESMKMKRLINEILELSRLESGRMTLKPEVVDVREAIESFFEKYVGFVEEQGLQLEMELFAANGKIDQMRFEQILANFLSNAAKYADEKRKVRVWMEKLDATLRICVYNSGMPIEEAIKDDLWKGFYKADEARASNETTMADDNSFGLGLSIVKAIQQVAGLPFGMYNADTGVVFWFEVEKS